MQPKEPPANQQHSSNNQPFAQQTIKPELQKRMVSSSVYPIAPLDTPSTSENLNTHIDGKRIAAALVDLVLIFILLSLTDQGGLLEFNLTSTGYSINTGTIVSLSGTKGLITVLVIFLYFIFFETLKGGTIGKLAAGIRVVKEDGSKLSLGGAVTRNLCRIIDGFPYFLPYLLGMIVMATNKKRQRIGDKLAKSLVIKK